MQSNAARHYAKAGREHVHGWLARHDAEIIRVLLEAQAARSLPGGIAEIGVHHGKSFILLAQGLASGEKALAVDLFSLQDQNIDKSGSGDLAKLRANLKRFDIPEERVVIREQSSLDLTPQQVTEAVGPVRFFSVDGGHWLEITRNDLALAEQSIAPHGVIALDDFHRPEWPEVSAGLFAWLAQRRRPTVPFLIGYNKLYLCSEEWVGYYQEKIQADPFLRTSIVKTAKFMGQDVPVMSAFALPEYNLPRRMMFILRSFYPDLFCLIMRRLR